MNSDSDSVGPLLKRVILMQGKPLYWNEYGVGGGSNQNGAVKATTAAEAAANPYFGVFGSYTRANDPWVLYDLSQPSPVRDYLRYFYQQTVEYAEQTGVSGIATLRPSRASSALSCCLIAQRP